MVASPWTTYTEEEDYKGTGIVCDNPPRPAPVQGLEQVEKRSQAGVTALSCWQGYGGGGVEG